MGHEDSEYIRRRNKWLLETELWFWIGSSRKYLLFWCDPIVIWTCQSVDTTTDKFPY